MAPAAAQRARPAGSTGTLNSPPRRSFNFGRRTVSTPSFSSARAPAARIGQRSWMTLEN